MQEFAGDLAALVVPQVGGVVTTDDPWEPWRLVNAEGVVVEPVAAYLAHLTNQDQRSRLPRLRTTRQTP
jgi:hypothetical protein